jgi:hypothetical protein
MVLHQAVRRQPGQQSCGLANLVNAALVVNDQKTIVDPLGLGLEGRRPAQMKKTTS